jgi:2,4-dienoyl-CoA reductase-like NADH-dependent reductase (Old Yellow Enzyme family)
LSELTKVWEPFQIKNVELRNRIVRTPHTTALAGAWPGADPGIGDALIRFHEERAKGGVALTIIEAAGIHDSARYGPDVLSDDIISDYRRLVSRIAPLGMRLFQQLFHPGPHAASTRGGPGWAASEVPGAGAFHAPTDMGGMLSHSVTTEEIEEVIAGFAAAARRVREGGVDGVEIHGAHGYLLHSFMSRATNVRTDQYGGSLDNRLRIVRDVIAAVRREVGDDYVVGIRLSTEDGVENGTDTPECVKIATALAGDGQLDYVSMSSGNSAYQSARVFDGANAPHAYEVPFNRQVTRAIELPTILAGRFLSLDDAERVLADGDADLVSMVRALIADPQHVRKVKEGRSGEVRPCIGCSQACIGGLLGGGLVQCTVNVSVGHELTLTDETIEIAEQPLRVLIVGGGPAGLEAARVAALAGHHVVLHERDSELGGQLRRARANAARAETASVVDYWRAELERLAVTVSLNSEVDAAALARIAPDAVIVATGSRPRRDGFQSMVPGNSIGGFEADRVLTSWEVLEGLESGTSVGTSAVVYDDLCHYEAIDVAEALLAKDLAVAFVTRGHTVGSQLEGGGMGWEVLGQPHLAHLLRQSKFSLYPRSYLESMDRASVMIASQDAPERSTRVEADTMVMVSRNLPEQSVAGLAEEYGVPASLVGDAVHGAKLLRFAVSTGNATARSLHLRCEEKPDD